MPRPRNQLESLAVRPGLRKDHMTMIAIVPHNRHLVLRHILEKRFLGRLWHLLPTSPPEIYRQMDPECPLSRDTVQKIKL